MDAAHSRRDVRTDGQCRNHVTAEKSPQFRHDFGCEGRCERNGDAPARENDWQRAESPRIRFTQAAGEHHVHRFFDPLATVRHTNGINHVYVYRLRTQINQGPVDDLCESLCGLARFDTGCQGERLVRLGLPARVSEKGAPLALGEPPAPPQLVEQCEVSPVGRRSSGVARSASICLSSVLTSSTVETTGRTGRPSAVLEVRELVETAGLTDRAPEQNAVFVDDGHPCVEARFATARAGGFYRGPARVPG